MKNLTKIISIILILFLNTNLFAFQAIPQASCFNNSGPSATFGIWVYKGYADWKLARKDPRDTLVFSFRPGKKHYDVNELEYCFLIESTHSGKSHFCHSGQLKISQFEPNETINGSYSFILKNGAKEVSEFSASYCPYEDSIFTHLKIFIQSVWSVLIQYI